MKSLIADRDYKVSSACGIVGIINEAGERFSGEQIISAIATMRERSNGLGGGFAAYGIYPDYKDYYAFHLIYENREAKENTEKYLKENYKIIKDEEMPTSNVKAIKNKPIVWRYFLKPEFGRIDSISEEDSVVKTVMFINEYIKDAFVVSSGKNMGIFKGVGYPEDIGEFFNLKDYQGYIWTAHGRFPTNTVGWWGGAHPFGILDWSVVHNGEISSYGINKRYLQNFGYRCTLFTDTEVITYLFDLLVRKHNLGFPIAAKILTAPFWDEIDRMDEERKNTFTVLRLVYASALVNGPFAVVVANNNTLVGLNDRIKLRPLVAARKSEFLYVASEESAIMEICKTPDKVWSPKAGEPVIGRVSPVRNSNGVKNGEN